MEHMNNLTKNENAILKALIENSNYNIFTISLRQLSKLASIPYRTTVRVVKYLVIKGLITQINRANRSPSTYKIHTEKLTYEHQKVAPPVQLITGKVAPPVENLTTKWHHLNKNNTGTNINQTREYTEMSTEYTKIRNICNIFYSMLDNNRVYPTGIDNNINIQIIQVLITEVLDRLVEGEENVFCKQKTNTETTPVTSSTFIQIPLRGNSLFDVTEELINDYQKAYTFVDVKQTMREIYAWNFSNASKRKTARGILRHINTWLQRENRDKHKLEDVNERGVPILRHITRDMLIPVPHDLDD